MLDAHGRDFRTSTERVIAHTNERRIADTRQRLGTSLHDLGADLVSEPPDLLRPAWLFFPPAPNRQTDDLGIRRRWQIAQSMRERDRAKPAFNRRHALR